MSSYVRNIDVAADPARVWAVTSAVAEWPEWLPTVASAERLDHGPLRLGSRTRLRQPRLPAAVWEVTAYDEGRSFVWQSSSGGVTTTAGHEVRAADGGTELVLSVEQSGLLSPVVWLLLGRLTRGYVDREAEATRDRSVAG